MFDRFLRAGRQLLGDLPAPQPAQSYAGTPLRPRVLMIIHNPPVASQGGRRLTEIFGWNDPAQLARRYAADLADCSYGALQYQIVERIDADWFPPKLDGFRYTGDSYVNSWRARKMHEPDRIDYELQVAAFDLIGRYERNEIDEVWYLTFPYAGDYELTMVGRGAFWCNSSPVPNTGHCNGRFVIMGFNYERLVGEALEALGHRAESIMTRAYAHLRGQDNLYAYFIQHDHNTPGGAQVGWMHYAPNSVQDYDWGNRRKVYSACDDWLNFPRLTGEMREVDCADWGGGGIREHHVWWFHRLPKAPGRINGVRANWWHYMMKLDPDA